VTIGGLLGVYSDPNSQAYRYRDGTEVQFVGVVFEGRVEGDSAQSAVAKSRQCAISLQRSCPQTCSDQIAQ
jgi:hypothetical protein